MYCRFCGAGLPAQAQYCSGCGNAVGTQNSVRQSRETIDIARYIVGGVFLLLGILPYLIGLFTTTQNPMAEIVSVFGSFGASAAGILTSFAGLFSPLFLFTSFAVTVFTGATLLQKHRTGKQSLIVCMVLHALSLTYMGLLRLVLYAAPATAISFFTHDIRVIEAGLQLLGSRLDPLAGFWKLSLIWSAISVVTIAGCIVLLALDRSKLGAPRVKRPGNSAVGVFLTFLSLAMLSILNSTLSSTLLAPYGQLPMLAVSLAQSIFNRFCQIPCLLVIFVCVALSVLVKKKNWIVRLSVGATVVLAGLAMLLLSHSLALKSGAPQEAMILIPRRLQLMVINAMSLLMGLMFWLQAVAQNRMGTCAQVLIPSAIPIVFWITRKLCGYLLPSLDATPSMVLVAILLTGAAFLFSKSPSAGKEPQHDLYSL